MRKISALLIVLIFVFSCTIEREAVKPKEYEMAQVLNNPAAYQGKYGSYKNGVVVFKKTKDGKAAVAVVGIPVPKAEEMEKLSDSQVLIIKIPSQGFNLVKIGSIITVKGAVDLAEKEGKKVYYIDADRATITGQENIDDPDFEKLIEVVNQKISDDDDWDFFWTMYMYFFVIQPILFD